MKYEVFWWLECILHQRLTDVLWCVSVKLSGTSGDRDVWKMEFYWEQPKPGEQWEKRDKHKSKAGFKSPNDTEDRESKLPSSEVSWENQKANQE